MSETGITVKDLPIKTNALIEDVLLIVNEQGVNFQISVLDLFKDLAIPTRFSLGIDKVDNTSDAEKPLSKAVVDALSKKASVIHQHELTTIVGLVDILNSIYERIEMFENSLITKLLKLT